MQIFIDGFHVFAGARSLGDEIDYTKLIDVIAPEGNYHKLRFYTEQDPGNDRQKKFLTWLRTNGFIVITRPLRKDSNGTAIHANIATMMATDMLLAAHHGETEMTLVSGSADLVYPVSKLSDMGVRVELVSYRDYTPFELAASCDEITNLAEISGISSDRGGAD